MYIIYRDIKEFSCDELEELFISVEWASGKFPEKLQIAMINSDIVYSAWDGDKLVGLVNSMSDGIMNAYFPYLLVNPEYQGKGIGRELLSLMLEYYKTFLRKTLISYEDKIDFYRSCGFEVSEGNVPMSVTTLNI